MESVEIKLRGIDKREFIVRYTKKIVDILHEPEMSLEIAAGPITEEVSRLLESLGYRITAKRTASGWVRLQAVKAGR